MIEDEIPDLIALGVDDVADWPEPCRPTPAAAADGLECAGPEPPEGIDSTPLRGIETTT